MLINHYPISKSGYIYMRKNHRLENLAGNPLFQRKGKSENPQTHEMKLNEYLDIQASVIIISHLESISIAFG